MCLGLVPAERGGALAPHERAARPPQEGDEAALQPAQAPERAQVRQARRDGQTRPRPQPGRTPLSGLKASSDLWL